MGQRHPLADSTGIGVSTPLMASPFWEHLHIVFHKVRLSENRAFSLSHYSKSSPHSFLLLSLYCRSTAPSSEVEDITGDLGPRLDMAHVLSTTVPCSDLSGTSSHHYLQAVKCNLTGMALECISPVSALL